VEYFAKEEALLKYKSNCQRARSMSEKWFSERMYCPACSSDKIECLPNNHPVADFICPECAQQYQLKSQSKLFSRKVNDGAYNKMMEWIDAGNLPNFFFLHYDPSQYSVLNLLLVPSFFFSSSIIEERKPLSDSARRSGWIGCNILFSNLAEQGKIKVIEKGRIIQREQVRESWQKVQFIKNKKDKSWANDILWCINKISKKEFSLSELYKFEEHLKGLHPENNNIQPKIRQQLQFMRDKGFLKFMGSGRYMISGNSL
jgi:type II restriction enzyme